MQGDAWPGNASATSRTFNHQDYKVHRVCVVTQGHWVQQLSSRTVTRFDVPLDKSICIWQARQTRSLYDRRAQQQEMSWLSKASRLPSTAGLSSVAGDMKVCDVDGDVLDEDDPCDGF